MTNLAAKRPFEGILSRNGLNIPSQWRLVERSSSTTAECPWSSAPSASRLLLERASTCRVFDDFSGDHTKAWSSTRLSDAEARAFRSRGSSPTAGSPAYWRPWVAKVDFGLS